jgi:hypothetical protein
MLGPEELVGRNVKKPLFVWNITAHDFYNNIGILWRGTGVDRVT